MVVIKKSKKFYKVGKKKTIKRKTMIGGSKPRGAAKASMKAQKKHTKENSRYPL